MVVVPGDILVVGMGISPVVCRKDGWCVGKWCVMAGKFWGDFTVVCICPSFAKCS